MTTARPGVLGPRAQDEVRVAIESDADIVTGREKGKVMALALGFSSSDAVLIATTISELARNIIRYARRGEIILKRVRMGNRDGIEVMARDEGPGIADVELAMQVGYSTSGGFGLGLPGVRKLMDDFAIDSRVGQWLTVIATKWRRR